MKHLLATLLLLAATFNIAAHQKIQDTFFGCVIGQSTKNEVSRQLNNLGLPYIEKQANVFWVYDILFGGSIWDYGTFYFNSDGVLYLFRVEITKQPGELRTFRDNIIASLTRKYGDTPDGYGEKRKEGFSFYWEDDSNVLWCFFEYNPLESVSLFYSNTDASNTDSDF